MTSDELIGSFETTKGNMEKMFRWASAPFDEKYDQVYLNLADEEIRTVANAGQAIIAYCDFTEPFVQNIELHDDIDGSVGMESILKVPQVQSYLGFVGGNDISVEFYGQIEEVQGENGTYIQARAKRVVLDGDLRAEIYVPNSESDYKAKQLAVVNVYDDDEQWIKNNGEPLKTSFTTDVEEFQRIVDVVSFDNFALANYPVVIEDGKFMLAAADENNRDSVRGELEAEDVEGEDVDNSYSRGFEQLFGNISGELDVQVEDDAPISIVRQSSDEALTLRYCILPAQ